MENTALIAGLALLGGVLIGILIDRAVRRDAARSRRLEHQVDQLRHEYTRYQVQVNEHFMETAHLVRRMNEAYRDIHQHLAKGASRLCNDEEWQDTLEDLSPRPRIPQSQAEETAMEPPRDYAPKAGPKDKGTLSADFGLGTAREERRAR